MAHSSSTGGRGGPNPEPAGQLTTHEHFILRPHILPRPAARPTRATGCSARTAAHARTCLQHAQQRAHASAPHQLAQVGRVLAAEGLRWSNQWGVQTGESQGGTKQGAPASAGWPPSLGDRRPARVRGSMGDGADCRQRQQRSKAAGGGRRAEPQAAQQRNRLQAKQGNKLQGSTAGQQTARRQTAGAGAHLQGGERGAAGARRGRPFQRAAQHAHNLGVAERRLQCSGRGKQVGGRSGVLAFFSDRRTGQRMEPHVDRPSCSSQKRLLQNCRPQASTHLHRFIF